MDSLKNYNIEFVKLKLGEHHFDYEIEDSFFNIKLNSLIERGNINVHLLIDKKERLMDLHFTIEGIVKTECDVCLDNFDLPIKGSETVLIKIEEEPKESDGEILYLGPNEISFNVYDHIYEIICTAIPMAKTCKDNVPKSKNCNPDMLKFLSESKNSDNTIETQTDPRWEKLKNIKN
ncbi:MAG: YceD family protein [Bacteroidia bacterium]